jgi:phosphatidylinositol glycan class Q protein
VLNFVSGAYTFVYYKRHTIRSLRFYSLHPFLSLAVAKHEPTVFSQDSLLLDHDFTAPHPTPSGGLSDTTISQFNLAKHIENCLLEVPNAISHRFDPIAGFETMVALASGLSTAISPLLSTVFSTPIPLGFSSPLLKDVSATVQQLDVRTEQADFLTNQAASLSSGAEAALKVAPYAARYVK